MTEAWQQIVAEVSAAVHGEGRFPLRAYSELMPPPYVGSKPYAPGAVDRVSYGISHEHGLDIDEYEQAHDLEPGLDTIANHLLQQLGKLVRGNQNSFSHTLLDGNPAWPAALAEAAKAGKLAHDRVVVICPLALSRSQDDKGISRWTLFGGSHLGAACWDGFTEDTLTELVAWSHVRGDWRIIGDDVPAALRGRVLGDESVDELGAIITFVAFADLPVGVQAAYLAGTLALLPSPASLIFFEHPRYRALARELPRAMQIPLLHLFPRLDEGNCSIRIPQSGWLDEDGGRGGHHRHHLVPDLERTHRWQRKPRDAGLGGDDSYSDKVSVALFSTDPVDIELYAKPLARNSQIWTADYALLLDGPAADREAILRAAKVVLEGGRYGYRMYYPPMRAGVREVFWHLPLIASRDAGRFHGGPRGVVTAELPGAPSLRLAANLLERPMHVAAARALSQTRGYPAHTPSYNAAKLLDTYAFMGRPLAVAHARALLRIGKHATVDDWLAGLRSQAATGNLASALRDCIDDTKALDPGAPLVLHRLGTRAFEEQIWTTISNLAHGEFRQKNDADSISVNRGKHGGPAAKAAHLTERAGRDLEALGDHLHARYRALIAAHDMEGRAEVVDHVFRWETDFAFPWMDGWVKNQEAPSERNIVLVIPGNHRGEAIVMADHYDTAYMEDVYYPEKGGDLLRAPAAGADDNHSATTALLLAAEQLLPLARAGKLERDVWLVHLTGEEYPGDCLGARALCQALVERSLRFTREDGSQRQVTNVEVVGAFVLDMIGHNTHRDRDIFQIAPGEGAGSARLAQRAHHATLRWNRCAVEWSSAPDRRGLGRARRMPDGSSAPPPFAHLQLHGEIRVEWEPQSALYNTDGQIFSDVGIPVVLFMENYDISRTGYHDTLDTMANIDLDYCAALTAIAIETVVSCACEAS
ncbi:MAG: M28 family peptidase [Kofleriaceae bacterium]